MLARNYFADLTAKRKTALVVAGLLALVWLAWIIFAIARTPPAQWSAKLAIVIVTLGALSSAIVFVELFRPFFRVMTGWADREHFRCVAIVFALLAVVQNGGVLLTMSTHGVHAF
jgi:hypothetical protein